jgi:pilus assembly protein CpaB
VIRSPRVRGVPMPIRNIATLAVAIFFGLVAVILVRNYVGRVQQPGTVAGLQTRPVVVAAQPIVRGAALQPSMLKVIAFPGDAAPVSAFADIAQVTGAKEGPRLALRSFAPDEPLLSANVSVPGGRPNLSDALGSGMRAVSLRSNDVAGVAGFVLPGDRVDVLLTREMAGGKMDAVSQVLAENIRVLGIDQSDNNEATKPVVSKAVTVEVTPDQAEAISLGQAVGEVSLALRRVADDAPLVRRATTVADLSVDLRRKPAVAAVRQPARKVAPDPTPPPPQAIVRVVRGVDATMYTGTDTSLTPLAAGRGGSPVVLPSALVRP